MPAFKEKDQSLGASRTAPGVRPLSDPCRQRLRAGCWCRCGGLVAAALHVFGRQAAEGRGGGGGFAQRPYIGGTFACVRARAVVCVLRSLGDARGKLGVQQECVEVDVLRGLRRVPGWCVRGSACGEEEQERAPSPSSSSGLLQVCVVVVEV